ncbi:MAG: rhodanese-like domain-containing protein [Polyangiaceae bacterium]|nr:rhodanese-like domain-containing protein [Polyangiaceae bacterium]
MKRREGPRAADVDSIRGIKEPRIGSRRAARCRPARLLMPALLTLPMLIFLPSCDKTPTQKSPQPCLELNGDGARQLIERQQAILMDVREPEEFQSGHIEGAINVPVGEIDERLSRLEPGSRLIVYCRSGRRAHRAATKLRNQGFKVYELGSMSDWNKTGNKCAAQP